MKIHITKKSGKMVYKNLPACGTRPKRNAHVRIYSTQEFNFFSNDLEMVCEKCLSIAKEQSRL